MREVPEGWEAVDFHLKSVGRKAMEAGASGRLRWGWGGGLEGLRDDAD